MYTKEQILRFPVSRDPPEGGTSISVFSNQHGARCFQFLGIPPKGEREIHDGEYVRVITFPVSRDPPEGGTLREAYEAFHHIIKGFQFLGIPPKGERRVCAGNNTHIRPSFQFLGIPPKGEQDSV